MLARINNYEPNEEGDGEGEAISEEGDYVPFLKEAVVMDSYTTITHSGKSEIKKSGNRGKEKFSYYVALNVFTHNVNSKISNNDLNFETDEAFLLQHLSGQYMSYARISALMLMANAFEKAGNNTKRNEYYNRIFNDKYDLSGSAVTDYYRTIADQFIEEGDKVTALKWLKAGVELNPKLGVKKQIAILEKVLGE